MLVRPCLLVVDPEIGGIISSRKLVLESARFNVIATYSCEEALATLERFPRIHGVILNAAVQGEECTSFLSRIKKEFPETLRLLVGMCDIDRTLPVDYFVESYSPAVLLETLRAAFPQHAALQATLSGIVDD